MERYNYRYGLARNLEVLTRAGKWELCSCPAPPRLSSEPPKRKVYKNQIVVIVWLTDLQR